MDVGGTAMDLNDTAFSQDFVKIVGIRILMRSG
jgi:hypothetical protein